MNFYINTQLILIFVVTTRQIDLIPMGNVKHIDRIV